MFAMDRAAVLIIVLALIAGVALHVFLRRGRGPEGKGLIHQGAGVDAHCNNAATIGGPTRLPLRDTTRTLKLIWRSDDHEIGGLDDFDIPPFLRKRSDGDEAPCVQVKEVDSRSNRISEPDYSAMAVPSVWRTNRAAPEASKEEWGFHITVDFRKAVRDLDKSMRGRVLDAITEICQDPMRVRGDTIKPLSGEFAGCWRYRLGDYRLVYLPVVDVRRIDLITIGGRGSVYLH